MNKIDATHLPMRVQSDKGGYWSQPSKSFFKRVVNMLK